MQKLHSYFLRLFVAIATLFAVSSAHAGVDELPTSVQDSLYNPKLLDPNQPIGDSAYRDWVANNPPPWKVGYASS